MSTTRLLTAAAALALLATSCGQLPGTHQAGEREVGRIAAPVDGGPDVVTAPDPVEAAGGGTDLQERRRLRDPVTGEPAPALAQGVRGTDRTGVTPEVIRVGSHAPVTGAAPLPSRSFEAAADLYWRWLETRGEKVLGRTIELEFADDRYQPSTAIQVCRELGQRVFSMIGAGGTDQIQACGRYANNARIPYSSMGVTEVGLDDLAWYFALSMSYKAQGGLLAGYVDDAFAGKRVAAVVTDTPNFDDAVLGWEAGVQARGLNYYRTLRHPRGDTSWYNTFARELSQAGVEVVYMLTSPLDYIRFAQQADQQGFRPQYVGVGVTMGLNPVLDSGCTQVDGGIFFSPFPGLDWARDHAPEFFEASRHFGTDADDLAFAIWGFSKTSHELFNRYGDTYGNDLTREDWRDFLEVQREVRGGIFPELNFTPGDHFGADQVHILQADCASGEYRTITPFYAGR